MERSHKSGFSMTMGPLHLLVIALLIGGAYYIGTLKAKVDYLQSGGSVNTGTQPVAAAPQGAPPPVSAQDVPKPVKEDWVKGNRNAAVVLIEYSDMECPFCKQFHPTMQQAVTEYKDKIGWIFRHYPLSFHANAQKEAEAAECAGAQGGNDAFWKYLDTVMERTTSNGTGFALDGLVPLAKEQGINEAKFKECLDSGSMAQKIKDHMDGGVKAGVSGTPGTVVLHVKSGETRLIPGAIQYTELKATIDEFLKK